MRVLAIIPARYASSRFPGKPIVDINGTPMIIRVADIAVWRHSVFERSKSDRNRRAKTGIDSKRQTTRRITDSIALYLPPNVEESTSAKYEEAATGIAGFLVSSFGKELANNVVDLCGKEKKNGFKFLYSSEMPLWKKIEAIAKEIYGASEVVADTKIRDQLKKMEDGGFGKFPICVAKTQYSFSTDPNLKGAPSGHVLPIREVRLSSGAEFIVVICGSIMTMPGLPKIPAADSIKLNDKGDIEGLF